MQMDPVVLVGTLLLLSLAPFAVMMTTSYVKIVVVLSLVQSRLRGVCTVPREIAGSSI